MVLTGYRKAIAGGVASAASWFAGAFVDGSIEGAEWAALPLMICVGAGLVAVVRNTE